MAEKLIRIGRVSSVDTENGMARVTYPDMDGAVTGEFPLFSFTDEYKMPPIGSNVLVLHLSNGQSAGIVMGHFWNNSNPPHMPLERTPEFKKELASTFGEAFIRYDRDPADDGGTVTIHAKNIVLDGSVSVINGNVDITNGSVAVANGDVAVANGDVKAGAISLANHIHNDSIGGKTTKPS